MKRAIGFLLGWCLLLGGVGIAAAQDKSDGMMQPPKVLLIDIENMKPGKGGSQHAATESAFVQAMTAAKWPTHYLAIDALTGNPRMLFLVGYDSFEAWEKDNMATQANKDLSASLDRAIIADGDMLSSTSANVLVYRDDLSFRADTNYATMRYFEISRFKVKMGHSHEWDELVKMYKKGYEKAVPDARWATYESQYGMDNGGVYVIFTPMKSASEVDRGMGNDKAFAAAMGEDGMKKLSELSAACLDSVQTNLFMYNPRLSYPSEEWIKADPSFWKPMQ